MSQVKLFGSKRAASRLAGGRTKKVKQKKPLKKLAIFLTVILCLEGLYFFASYSRIPFITYWREVYINTALATMRHQWLATRLLPKDVVSSVNYCVPPTGEWVTKPRLFSRFKSGKRKKE